LPSEQQVLTFIADTIDWYRHLPTVQRIGAKPADLLFIEDNRSITTNIVRLSFEFGKAMAVIDPLPNSPEPGTTRDAPAAKTELQHLIMAKTKVDANTHDAVNQLKSLTEATLTARGADRKKLDTQMVDVRSRIQLLEAMSANYQNLLGFVRTASAIPDRSANMAALVENLERTVPDVSAAGPASPTMNMPADLSRAPYGIVGMISQVATIARKERVLDGVIERTDALTRSLQTLRTPFVEPFRRQFSTFALDASSLAILQRQQSRLADLVAQAKTASPAIAALIKQETLLNLYWTHLTERRSEIRMENRAAWRALLGRLGALGSAIAILLGIRAVVRRLMFRHVHDLDTRHMFLTGERLLLWLIIIVLVLFVFAFDLSSLATYLGLLSAGLAIGLHDVFLSIGGHLLIVRRFHVRIGDRVQIAGVTGEVANIGLFQLELSEIDADTEKRTGRVVFFSNSYVFVSPATPLFRQLNVPTAAHT
jgi:mechanosensitive ion channel-like protein